MYYFCLQYNNIFVDIQNVLLDLLQQARVVKLQFGTTLTIQQLGQFTLC